MSIENAILTLAEAINNLAAAQKVSITAYTVGDVSRVETNPGQCSGGCDKERSPAPVAPAEPAAEAPKRVRKSKAEKEEAAAPVAVEPEPEAPAAEPTPEPEKEAVEVTFDVLAKLVTDIVAKKGESIKPTIKAMIAKTGSAGLKLVAPEHYADLYEELLTLAD